MPSRSFVRSGLVLLGAAFVTSAAHAAEPAAESTVRHVVLEVGESFGVSAAGVRNYAYQDQGDVARVSIDEWAGEMRLAALHPGQAVLVLFDNRNVSRLLVLDVTPSTKHPPPSTPSAAPTPPAAPVAPPAPAAKATSKSARPVDRARERMVVGDYLGARAALLPVVRAGGSYEDAVTLRSVCKQLRDASCVALASRKLDADKFGAER